MTGRVTCYVLRVTCYVLRVTCYVLRVTCYVLRVTCYVTRVTCYVLRVTCYVLPVSTNLQTGVRVIVHDSTAEMRCAANFSFHNAAIARAC